MRKFRNLPKSKNAEISKGFGHLLKSDDDCSPDECRWVAVTVFDHWLHTSNSFDRIEKASDSDKKLWDSKINNFLRQLVELEIPTCYKENGKWSKRTLQFREYVGTKPMSEYVTDLFKETYYPQLAFVEHRFHVRFQDYWVIYLIYEDVELLDNVFDIAAGNDLFFLPVYSMEHLNRYSEVENKLKEKDLNKAIHATSM
jgi:hypothetical protein